MIREALIFTKQPFTNRDEVISFVADRAEQEGLLKDKEEFIQAVYRREEELPTSLGYGMAIPHGKTDVVKEPFMAFISIAKSFEWESTIQEPVEAIFLIGVPKTNTEMLHLKAIAEISKKLMNEDFRKQLYCCQTNHEAYEMLRDIDEKIKED